MVNLKKLKFWDNPIIEFYCHPDLAEIIPEPKSAVKFLPDWFRDLSPTCGDSEQRDTFGNKPMSAKKCLPLLDGMSLGFTIPICGDLHIRSNHNNTQIQVHNPPGIKVCEFHDANQVGGDHALIKNHGNPLKFLNYWVIKTAPGWSTLFIPPLNNFTNSFMCLSAMVDTDRYPKEVNFPAILLQTDVDEHITAGTPLMTVIPIKRESFNKKINIRKMSNKEFKQINNITKRQNNRTHHYTHELRVKK